MQGIDTKDDSVAEATRSHDESWYRRAVFYEVSVRAFHDSDADGTGDLRGLIAKLDYLQWLGVDCIWLLPLYQSPLRDGGYDISDFRSILPEFGTMADLLQLVEEVHRRGMRVIVDLVFNITSDHHPWFLVFRREQSYSNAD